MKPHESNKQHEDQVLCTEDQQRESMYRQRTGEGNSKTCFVSNHCLFSSHCFGWRAKGSDLLKGNECSVTFFFFLKLTNAVRMLGKPKAKEKGQNFRSD